MSSDASRERVSKKKKEEQLSRSEFERELHQSRQANKVTDSVKRGIIRYLVVIVDMSDSMQDGDFQPSRHAMVCKELLVFLDHFFAQNPLRFFLLFIPFIPSSLVELVWFTHSTGRLRK